MISTFLAASGLLQGGSTEITVYNQGLGFVKDVRMIKLHSGQQNVVIEDVAQQIDASSVGFKCLNNPGSVSVLEQNYQYDLISPEAILQKSVGKRIRFTRTMGTTKESIEGVLLSSPVSVFNTGNGGEVTYNGLVIKADDGRIILSPEGEIDVLELPEGLISKPSLLWQLESSVDQDARMELSYLTKGLSWQANYVLTINDGGGGDLQGWATLNNQSGLSFTDAKLKLLAGDVNTLNEDTGLLRKRLTASASKPMSEAMTPAFKEEGLFEYHLYTLQRPASVRNKESKQLNLLEGFNIPVQKVISFESWADDDSAQTSEMDSSVKIKFTNNEKSHLGMPMPAGKIRLYQRDSKGSVQFLGENQIQHTPRDEKLSFEVGKSFDIKGTHKRTSWTKVSKNLVRMSFEVEVRNRKKEGATVYLYEHQMGDWKMTSKSQDYIKDDSATAVFEVKLKANEVKTVKYTVEVKR